MNRCTIEDIVFIVKTYYRFRECFAETRRKYSTKFGISKSSSVAPIKKILDKFEKTDSA